MLPYLCWLTCKLLYRLKVVGRENLPKGGALVVCNHVTYIDGMLMLAASRRGVRFVVESDSTQSGFVAWFIRTFVGVIPIPRRGPKGMKAALDVSVQLIQQGYLVCIFPEGYPTRCSAMLKFRRGFEHIAERANCPIIPACIDRMWGSMYSYFGGKVFTKWPNRRAGRVRMAFGAPLPSTATAYESRQAVQALLAKCAIHRSRTIRPVHRVFVRRAASQPFRPCLLDPADTSKALTFGKALTAAKCLAGVLKPFLGDAPMVGIWLPSSTGGALANIALSLLGKTSVNLNYTAGPSTVKSAIAQCKIRHVLTSKRFMAKIPCDPGADVQLLPLEEFIPKIGRWAKLATFLQILLLPGWLLELSFGLRRHRADDLATIIFSSGSTGEPKGVMLTHGNIASNVDGFAEHVDILPSDRIVGILPFFHSFGYTVTLWGPIVNGASAFYLPDPRAAQEVGNATKLNGGTIMTTTATFLRFYIRRCGDDDFKSLRLAVCGAEKLPVSLADEFGAKFGIRPFEGYGCTELSPVVSANLADVKMAGITQVRNKDGTIGHPLPGVACKVVHRESGELLSEDAEGLLLVTGPNVMRGYLGREKQTDEVIRDGWYVTGDIGRIDSDGFITLTGRQSRFAKIAGEMVPLERLEEEIHASMDTTERFVAVAAVPDAKRGERLVVLHVAWPDGWNPDRVCSALSERGLPNLWVPGPRDFFAVEAMPILGSGKLDLHKLSQVAAEVTK